jgi:hypothetical protein
MFDCFALRRAPTVVVVLPKKGRFATLLGAYDEVNAWQRNPVTFSALFLLF